MKSIILLLVLLLFSCDVFAGQAIDGSSQKRYQETLTRIISEAPVEYKIEIILMLEEKYKEFRRMFPGFSLSSDRSVNINIRPPEYLALLHGMTFNELVEQAKLRIEEKGRFEEAVVEPYRQAGEFVPQRKGDWVETHYIHIILIP